jgi:hypothetical protein
MEIHQRIFDAIPGYWVNAFEDIGRGIERGVVKPVEAAIAGRQLDALQNARRQMESTRLEYDINLEIDLETDLKVLDVALEGVRRFVANPKVDERAKIEAEIFRRSAFDTMRGIYDWSKAHKSA